jgi:hypothetical protein
MNRVTYLAQHFSMMQDLFKKNQMILNLYAESGIEESIPPPERSRPAIIFQVLA